MSNKIKDMGFSKLTNAEHLSFHNQVMLIVEKCGAENISAVEELALYKTSITSEVIIENEPIKTIIKSTIYIPIFSNSKAANKFAFMLVQSLV